LTGCQTNSIALRGLVGAAKWFLRARKVGQLSQGRRWIEEARQTLATAWLLADPQCLLFGRDFGLGLAIRGESEGDITF